MRIRTAGSADVAAIHDLVQRAYALYVPRIGLRPAPMDHDYAEKVGYGYASVAEEEGAIVGILVLIPKTDHLLVENVAVEPDRQGEGIGRELLAFAEVSAHDAGFSELRLYTNAAMTENLNFYPRLGYVETGRGGEDGFERAFFSKHLGSKSASS
jgi:N-acetylglutamate synthase-like GNAT family acetyltransferase